ncbi:MAG: hypothetical protein ACXAC7_24370, partial [Candidatus Hodarchaeales archaeon]
MAIFTRRGGSIVFLGFMSISIAIGMAGYQAISIITSTFLGGALDEATDGAEGMDFSEVYPANEDMSAGALGQIFGASFMEVMFSAIFNSIVTITPNLIFYFLILGTMLIFSVVSGYP